MAIALIIDDTCRKRAEELGVDPGDYRMWEAGWPNADIDAAIKREAMVEAAKKAVDSQS